MRISRLNRLGLQSPKVFSNALTWSLTIDNIVIPFERLANIRVSSSFSGLGTSGICRQVLTADIMLDGESFSQGAKCILADSDGKFKFPDFYINTRRKKGNVLSISAIDRTVYLGQMFD